jgi:tetratricopeptide (TPR) repeat protein
VAISLDRKKTSASKPFGTSHKPSSWTPRKPDFYNNRAFAYRKIKKIRAGSQRLHTLPSRSTPKNFKAFYNRALCYDKLKMFQEEEGDFRKAMELQPKNVNILYHLGFAL